jgi:glycosyltransferase involved in cell wall biosynthesis
MISILVATYNGENYIADQLESLLNQTYQNFKVFVRDDCSTDNTLQVLERYHMQYPNKIYFSKSDSNSGSAKHTFFTLMLQHKDDFVMLCDQDDVWKPNKIEISLCEMNRMRNQYGADTPILVHTDLTVVDENLSLINPSYKKMLDADYSRKKLNHLLSQNILTGCTSMLNLPLANLINKEPEFCIMHDWWIIMVASCFGYISGLDKQTMYYRQHKNNSVGAVNVKDIKYQISKALHSDDIRTALNDTYIQAQNFLDVYQDKLSTEQVELIENYISIPNLSKIEKIELLIRKDFFKNTLSRKVAQLLYI